MMKMFTFFAAFLVSVTCFAQTNPKYADLCGASAFASPIANSAVVPVPRVGKEESWIATVHGKIDSSIRKNAHNPVQVIFDGDSITAFWETRAPELWHSYQEKYNAVDFAISGDSTENVLCRLNMGQANGLHPKLIFIMIGHNNLMNNTSEQIYEGVAAIVAKYRKICPDATIILQATFPTKEPRSNWRKAVDSLDKLLPKLAQGDKIAYVDFGDKFLSPDGTLSKDIFPDGTHPVQKGFEIWAAAIQPILDQYLPPSSREPRH